MRISAVIATCGRPNDVAECVESLLSGFETPEEIVVVDDGDVDETRAKFAERGVIEDVTHIEGAGKNVAAARNTGIRAASGDLICFVDDDVIVPPNWLEEILDTYDRHDDVMGVGGYVLNFNPKDINKANVESFGYRALTAFRHLFLQHKVGQISPVGILWSPHIFMTSELRNVEALQGCNMTFRSEVFEDVMFDEWYGTKGSSACEEQDFSSRVAAAGHRLVYNPHATVVHKRAVGDGSRRGDPNYDNITNLTYFVLRNPKLGVANYVLFVGAMLGYALASRDLGYARGIIRGTKAYIHNDERHGEKV
jgi:GT2 family glycosyltransferase